MTDSELYYTLALLQVEGVGDIVAKKLIHHCGSAEKVFQTKKNKLATIDGIGEVLIKKLTDASVFKLAEQEISYLSRFSNQYADSISWANMKDKYLKLFEDLCKQ
jgi:DNA processing protein